MFKKLLSVALLGCLYYGLLSDAAKAQGVPPKAEKQLAAAIADARRAVEVAQLRLRHYDRVEYPRRQRQLEADIAMTVAEVAKYRALLAEYKQISFRTIPEPLIISRQTTELALLGAELRLRDLRDENLLLIRYRSDQYRLYQLEVEAAQDNLRRLQAER